MKMDAHYSKKTILANRTKAHTTRPVKTRNFTDESGGFCICPNCFHLVFDELLTGICSCCQCQFCSSCSVKKESA